MKLFSGSYRLPFGSPIRNGTYVLCTRVMVLAISHFVTGFIVKVLMSVACAVSAIPLRTCQPLQASTRIPRRSSDWEAESFMPGVT
jgi:hypothetical protein